MEDQKGQHIIRSLQQRWQKQVLFYSFLLALSMSFVVTAILHKFNEVSWWLLLPVLPIAWFFILIANRNSRIRNEDVIRFLDRNFPSLEESSGLLLQPVNQNNLLQQLQYQKISARLQGLSIPDPLIRKLRAALAVVVVALGCGWLIQLIPETSFQFERNNGLIKKIVGSDKKPAGVETVNIKIVPPAYMQEPERKQPSFNLKVEEGATVVWQLKTTDTVSSVKLLFNDSSVIRLHSNNNNGTIWEAAKKISGPGFYQVQLADSRSEYYTIEAIPDLPPVISIQSPIPHSIIDFGKPKKVLVHTNVNDDYGIKDVVITATIASGSGESVKFREQQIRFPVAVNGARSYELSTILNLTALGMSPGDELYFYLKATDSHNKETRSDVMIVSIPDTTELMSMDGIATPMNIKPEFFRSQRQIIIETEQLIKDKSSISKEVFNSRSNDLGAEQKLLRLRYGKFLGEENETNIGLSAEHDDHDHKPGNESDDFGNAEKILDEVTHKHDIAEDATFFDAATKKQLRATLTEMWNAELQLRLYKPETALPFEYKALVLLKDLQQQSRVYVAKTSVKTTPLKPDKRLTGDISKITSPAVKYTGKESEDPADISRNILGILPQLNEHSAEIQEIETLQKGISILSKAAAANPVNYLRSYQALTRILDNLRKNENPAVQDLTLTAKGFQQLLDIPLQVPSKQRYNGSDELSLEYFNQLNKAKQ
jgi:hypothetical protein